MRKRTDVTGQSESKDLDTRRYLAEDDEGHIKGSKQAEFNEQVTRKDDDNSEYNQKDDRPEFNDTTRSDL